MSGQRYDATLGPVLVGMRGSGTSTLAAPLAATLGFVAIDADAELERRTGRAIAEIFEAEGEPAFRSLERELLLGDLLRRPRCVLATGGGAVLHDDVRRALAQRVTIWLQAPLARLAQRVEGSSRPSLTGGSIVDELAAVLAAREALYGDVATLVVDTSSGKPDELAEAIAKHWRQLVSGSG